MTGQPALSAAELAELRTLYAQATPGPWLLCPPFDDDEPSYIEQSLPGGDSIGIGLVSMKEGYDEQFLVAAANVLPRLLDQLSTSEQARERAERENSVYLAVITPRQHVAVQALLQEWTDADESDDDWYRREVVGMGPDEQF